MNYFDLKTDLSNKTKVAIVCVGYNRIKSMTRLLDSLLAANYSFNDIPLVISIDCSGDIELYNYVLNFQWPYGDKYVNIQENRLGLKQHIYQCADLVDYFKAIILLEDDIVVGPSFYSYVQKALTYYSDESRIAQISLYKNEINGYLGLPFKNLQDGFDVFLMQDVSTWGECWTKAMWDSFKVWRDSHSEVDIQNVDMPSTIKGWERAWSKYYNAYVVDTGKYVLYPNVAVSTNFSDAGEHGGDNHSIVQTNLLQSDFEYRFGPYDLLTKYDIYFNNTSMYQWLGLPKEELCLDIYGFHTEFMSKKYILSTKKLPYCVERTFALYMRPMELNVKNNINGHGIYLYDTTNEGIKCRDNYSNQFCPYHLQGFNAKLLLRYIVHYILKFIKRKFTHA